MGEGERWVSVPESWLGHRPEPLIHERLWSCPLTGDGPFRGQLDAQGRGLAYDQRGGYAERTTYADDRIVVAGVVETILEHGRPVRSVYPSGDQERYHYDGDRLVAIDEAAGLHATAAFSSRDETGGRLLVTHDDRGPKAIDGVWERLDEPWVHALARGASEIAAEIVGDVRRVVQEPLEGVVSLTLIYDEGAGLHYPTASLNHSRDPMKFAYPYGREGAISEIESVIELALADRMLCQAALHSIDPPQRTVLNAVATILARQDWSAIFDTAKDFVVFIAEHDEDVRTKIEAIRVANPPERAELWATRLRGI